MELSGVKYLRGARQGRTKLLIVRRHTRNKDQTSTAWVYRFPASTFKAFFRLRRVWLSLFSLVFPLLLFCFVDSHDARFRCLYVVCVMISSWLTAANDPALVAIYPVILCPLLGVAGVKSLAESYFRPVSFLMFGTSLMAAAFSRTGLDATISSFILNKFHSNPPLLCLGLMLCSAMLSMWINNASTAVILSPIAVHVLAGWAKRLKEEDELQHGPCSVSERDALDVSSRSTPVAPPTPRRSLVRMKSPVSIPAEAVSSVIPSKEAINPYMEKAHGKAYNNCLVATKAPLNSRREQKRSSNIKKGTPVRVTAVGVKIAGALLPAAAVVQHSLIGGRAEDDTDFATRTVSDAGAVVDHSASDYCDTSSSTSHTSVEDKNARFLRRLKNAILLGIAYSATLGGMSTLNGSFVTPTLVHVLESSYDFDSFPGQENPINFTSWMAFACPLSLVCVFLAWLALSTVWLGIFTTAHAVVRLLIHPFTVVLAAVNVLRQISQRFTRKGLPSPANLSATCDTQDAFSIQSATDSEVYVKKEGDFCIQSRGLGTLNVPNVNPCSTSLHITKSDEVGGHIERSPSNVAREKEQTVRSAALKTTLNPPVKKSHPFAQVEVLLLLVVLVSLWLTRSTGDNGKRGWGVYFVPNFVDDSVPVLLLGFFLFFLPLEPPDFTWNCFCCRMKRALDEKDDEDATNRLAGHERRRSRRSSEAHALQPGHPRLSNYRGLERGSGKERGSQDISRRTKRYAHFRREFQRGSAHWKEYTPILTYSYAVKHIEWGALLLLGGGFAMATSMKRTGLDLWIGNAVLHFAMLDRPALVVSVLLLASCLTEVMSNTATANVLLPILNGVARQAKDSPLLVLIPATRRVPTGRWTYILYYCVGLSSSGYLSYSCFPYLLCTIIESLHMGCFTSVLVPNSSPELVGAQFAFMLPLGTAPNAVVLKKGKLRPLDMFWTGFVVKFFAIGVTLLAMMTWSDWLFNLKTRPVWAG